MLEEAEHLWAAERNARQASGICARWGRVCILKNPAIDPAEPILKAWQRRITEIGSDYTAAPTAEGEDSVLDPATGLALFDWPIDTTTNQPLAGFDLLLTTATDPTPLLTTATDSTLCGGRYPTAEEIANAWRTDVDENVLYFHNNRHYGITTFEDDLIRAFLRGDPASSNGSSE